MSLPLYFDEDSMDEDVLGPLRLRGIGLETTTEAGMLERTDDEQLTYAATHQRVVVTSNVGDYARLHQEYVGAGRAHAGIVLIHQQRMPVGEIIRRLLGVCCT